MRKLIVVAAIALLLPLYVSAQAARVLYDSGSIAAGAQIQTPVLDFATAKVSELTVIVDNTAGTASRDLTLTAYLEDGATQVDSTLLRRIYFGGVPTGGSYASGQARGYVGPNPPGGASGSYVLALVSSAANSPVSTPVLVTEECDELSANIYCGGGAGTITTNWWWNDEGGVNRNLSNPTAASGSFAIYTLGRGSGSVAVSSSTGLGFSVPKRIQVDVQAAGASVSTNTAIVCRGRLPGSFAVQQLLPMRGRITLAAGGSGAARVTVLGR